MTLQQRILGRLPRPLRRPFQRLWYLPADTLDLALGRRDPLCPSRGRMFDGAATFREIGREFLGHLRELGGLQPSARVLDVGSGIGRLAIPLTAYLNPRGSYTGLDVTRSDIEWCRRSITSRYPNFRFEHADVFNSEYNPDSSHPAEKYSFPFPSESYDMVCAVSLFTHLLERAAARYAAEASRVLVPQGVLFLTLFLLNPESLEGMRTSGNGYHFEHRLGSAAVRDPATPEAAVAYDEAEVRSSLQAVGLTVQEPIHYGSWSGRQQALTFQDIVVARKVEPTATRSAPTPP